MFVAAVLKAYSPAESALLSVAYNIPVWGTVLLVQVELTLTLLFIIGHRVRDIYPMTLILFSLFVLFSLYRAFAGYESCGCFGAIKVNLWWIFGMDLAIACLFALIIPKKTLSAAKSLAPAIIFFLIVGLLIGVLMAAPSPSELANATLISAGGLIILEPEEWSGKTFPLTDEMEPRIDVSEGERIVLIHNHSRPDCREAKPKYRQRRENDANVFLIEASPLAKTGSLGSGRVASDDHEWFVDCS